MRSPSPDRKKGKGNFMLFKAKRRKGKRGSDSKGTNLGKVGEEKKEQTPSTRQPPKR